MTGIVKNEIVVEVREGDTLDIRLYEASGLHSHWLLKKELNDGQYRIIVFKEK